ncbi:Fic family protein [Gemmatimonadota bacterium]
MYIWQNKAWPEIQYDHDQLVNTLAQTRHDQGLLLGRMEALGFHLRDEAALLALTQEVLTSSAIEGENLDPVQVRSSLARRLGIDIGGLTPATRDIEGIVEMMVDATQHFDKPLDEQRLLDWHSAIFPTGRSGMSVIRAGAWRDDLKGPMQVVSGQVGNPTIHFEAPPAKQLEAEVSTFLNWYNDESDIDDVLKAGIAHLWFVTIHPFDDGNGRIARAVAEMTLARSEKRSQRFYSISSQIRNEQRTYYMVLERTQKGTLDITHWLDWFLGCMTRAIDRSQETLATVILKARFWEKHATEPFNTRQIAVLNKLLDGLEGKLTSSKWAKLTKCSQDTAYRDILDLIERGVLTKNPEGGRSTSYSLELES